MKALLREEAGECAPTSALLAIKVVSTHTLSTHTRSSHSLLSHSLLAHARARGSCVVTSKRLLFFRLRVLVLLAYFCSCQPLAGRCLHRLPAHGLEERTLRDDGANQRCKTAEMPWEAREALSAVSVNLLPTTLTF
jgi:hypothetical protein